MMELCLKDQNLFNSFYSFAMNNLSVTYYRVYDCTKYELITIYSIFVFMIISM